MSHTQDSEFLQVLSRDYKGTPEVSNEVGLSRRGTAARLNKLVDKGLVEKKKDKGNLYWRITDEGETQL